jgi:hypothetical protein
MSYVKISDGTIVNLNQIQYCKMYRMPVEGHLVPNARLQVFFSGMVDQNSVDFFGEEAERLWQLLEYKSADRPESPIDED